MSGRQVSLLLQECLQCAVSGHCQPAEPKLLLRRGQFPDELDALLQEAAARKWPFVEEKWQYKQSVSSEDKINSSDLIRSHLPQLLLFLRDCIAADEPDWAVAVLFLLDRLLYWMDGSLVLLKVAKALHKRYPDVPIAPQVIIRQARVYLNTGKMRKAEFILSSLIKNNASTGCWSYQKASDQTLVQAVCLQVRGQVLQTLGLWLESAELIWASLIGFYTLPQPDKKGIGTSLGLLANILTSMSEQDFTALQNKPHINLSFLGETCHRLLSAAQAAKMAVVFSQYGSLYVLTNVVAQGICLLSYSFSRTCPTGDQQTYLKLAKEAFEIGLLTKTTRDVVTSKLELHTFLKAAYSLTMTHRWMSGPSDSIITATSICRQALTLFVRYCSTADSSLCGEIMAKIQQIKSLLKVDSFRNSDPQSFIPDSYRSMEFEPVFFTLNDFEETLNVFDKHHKSVCETLKNDARSCASSSHAQCITAFQTNTEVLTTEISTSSQNPTDSNQSDQCCHNTKHEALGEYSEGGQEADNAYTSFRNQPTQSPAKTLESRRRNFQKKQEARTSSSSNSSHTSWERVSGRSQSSIETEEDAMGPLPSSNEIGKDSKVQGQSQPTHEDIARKNIRKNLEARTSLSSHSNCSSWEHVLRQSQSSMETEDDSSTPGHNESIQSQSQPMQEPATTNEPSNTSGTQRIDVPKKQARTFSSSFGSGSSWEHVVGQSQSSIETEEDFIDPSQNANGINANTKIGTCRHNKDTQSQSQPLKVTLTTEDLEDEPPSESCSPQRDLKKNLGTRTSLSSCSTRSSFERVLGQSQSSVETEEDFLDPSQNANGINVNVKVGDSRTCRHNKETQSSSQPLKVTFTTEDLEDEPPSTSHSPQRDVQKNLGARTSLSSCSTRSSFERVLGQSQSSVETEEDFIDPSQNANGINANTKIGDSRTCRHNKETQSQSQPLKETFKTEDLEDEPPNISHSPQRDVKKNLGARTSISSCSTRSSFEHVVGQSQSSVETEEDADVGETKGGSPSSFSLCDSSGSLASWQKLSMSPSANVEDPELMHKKERRDQFEKVPSLQVSDKIGEHQETLSEPFEDLSLLDNHQKSRSSIKPLSTQDGAPPCSKCFKNCIMGSEFLTELDYRSLLAGVCHRCLVERLPNKPLEPLEERGQQKAYDAVILKYSKSSDVWMGCETSVYIGRPMGVQGQQRRAIQVQYLHQEQLLSSYVGKEYLKEKGLHAHLDDVERQMTAQYYVNEFNKCLYNNNVTTQIFFIPSEVLLVLEMNRIVTCLSAEPYMSGTFVKLTNNTNRKDMKYEATQYGIAFGHFTYEFSSRQEVVVDLQGWITANGKGLTYLTDPQIHSLRRLKSSRSQQTGINNFIRHQHGEECNDICRAARLRHIT